MKREILTILGVLLLSLPLPLSAAVDTDYQQRRLEILKQRQSHQEQTAHWKSQLQFKQMGKTYRYFPMLRLGL